MLCPKVRCLEEVDCCVDGSRCWGIFPSTPNERGDGITGTKRKLEDDLRLLAKRSCLDKDESKFAKEVLEIDASQITDKEKESIFQITSRY